MFFLSKNILSRLFECKEFFDKVTKKSKIDLNQISDKPVIVKIENIIPILDEKHQVLSYLAQIFDGKIRKDCLLDRKYNVIEKKEEIGLEFDEEKLQKGSIIIIEKYKVDTYCNFVGLKDKSDQAEVLFFIDLKIIGLDDVEDSNLLNNVELIAIPDKDRETEKEISSRQISNSIDLKPSRKFEIISDTSDEDNNEEDDVDINTTNSINALKNFIGIEASLEIKAKLIMKTLVREFKKPDGSNGKVIRLLLADSSGTIEAVAFDGLCDTIMNLLVDRSYLIKDFKLKQSKKNYKAWPAVESMDLELSVINSTIIKKIADLPVIFEDKLPSAPPPQVSYRSSFLKKEQMRKIESLSIKNIIKTIQKSIALETK